LAVLNGHTNVVEYLLGEGVNWKIANAQGKKPVDYARKAPMKKLFTDAEQGVFNAEDNQISNSNNEKVAQVLMKKKGMPLDPKLVEELVAAGYPRGNILDAIYTITEKGDNASLASVMTLLEKQKAEQKAKELNDSKEKNNKMEEEDNCCKIWYV
jgi:hypothetical protein